MSGLTQEESVTLAQLTSDPSAYGGRTVRLSVRVVQVSQDARGVWLDVVPWQAPLQAQTVRFLIPKGEGGERYLELSGRDLDLVVEIEKATAKLFAEGTAIVVRPVSYVTRFAPATEEARTQEVGEKVEGVGAQPDETSR
jgi:hypothetical protein